MDAEAAVNPHDQQQNGLQDAEHGREHPEHQQLLLISGVEAKLDGGDARAEEGVGQQERNRESENELGRLQARPAESAPLIESPEAEAHMRQKRKVEDRRAGERMPD